MASEKILKWTKRLEDPKHPLLGPTLKGLYLFGLWQTGSRLRTVTYNIIHSMTLVFVVTEFIYLHSVRHDIIQVLNNLSLAGLSIICFAKCYAYVAWQNQWRDLVQTISEEELLQIERQDRTAINYMKKYTKYSRTVTYLYWGIAILTNLFMIAKPFLRYASKAYREDIKEGIEPYPQIICSWFPFDKTKMPGYLGALFIHIAMSTQGSGVLAVYDTNALAILCYLKGQMTILKRKCEVIFDDVTSTREVLDKIKECYRHHSVLLKQHKLLDSLLSPTMFLYVLLCSITICCCVIEFISVIFRQHKLLDSLLSPTMFLYVLLCSITICCCVIEFISEEVAISQKLWIVEFTSGLVLQLFMFCWHSNEVTVESREVDRAIYGSKWWRGDVRVRRQLLLLAGKLNHPLVLNAGPFNTLSMSTFIDIMKGTYSFFTLFSQMQEDN